MIKLLKKINNEKTNINDLSDKELIFAVELNRSALTKIKNKIITLSDHGLHMINLLNS